MADDFKPFKPLGTPDKPSGWGIQPLGPSPVGGGDIHDTFKVDRDGTIGGGHTTIQNPGGQKIRMPWDPKP